MKYIGNTLNEGEKVTHVTYFHWICFWPALFFLILYLSVKPFAELWLIIAILSLCKTALNVITSEFGVTTQRMISKTGFIMRDTKEIYIVKIESVEMKQGILGRILGYGTLIVCGSGGQKIKLSRIIDPVKFRQKLGC